MADQQSFEKLKEKVRSKAKWFEVGFMSLTIWFYCLPFLKWGPANVLPGLEADYFQGFDHVLWLGIKKFGQFPLWDPYISTGLPYIAHPMLHAYNPFISLPVLFFGADDGFKIALFLGFLIAGLGMWWLGQELGLSPLVRLWLGLMYAFSGIPAGKFIQGHYLMVFGFGWIPVSLAALLAASRTHHKTQLCMAAISLALLFLSGNEYYAYYMLYVVAIYSIIIVLRPRMKPIGITFQWSELKILASLGVLAFGLVAVQLLPLLDYRVHYLKPINTQLTDSQGLLGILVDIISPEPFLAGAYSSTLPPEELFSYLGWWPFVGLFFLPLAWKTKNKFQILFLGSLLLFTLLWVDVKDMPWRSLFTEISWLSQFRYPSRMVAVGAPALIATCGMGLDSLREWTKNNTIGKPWFFALMPRTFIVIFMAFSIINLAITCRPLLHTIPQIPQPEIGNWLSQIDSSLYYVEAPGDWREASLGGNLRYLKTDSAILDLSASEPQISERQINAAPKYVLLGSTEPIPGQAILLKDFTTLKIYQLPQSLPFVFIVSETTLTTPASSSLSLKEVTPVTSFTGDLNSFTGKVMSKSTGVLVLLSTYNPDWNLTVDGVPAKIYNAYGYLATEVRPGTYQYHFVYQPVWFFVGLAISLMTCFIILVFFFAELYRYFKVAPI